MISAFLRWWGQQLLSLLPAGHFGLGSAVLAKLTLAPDGPGLVDVSVRHRGSEGVLGRFTLNSAGMAALRGALGPRRLPVELRLPPGMVLEQDVTLPLAAEQAPERVLHYEMDRLTPFAADELFWQWAVRRRDKARGQLNIRLLMAQRAPLLPVVETLREAGLHTAVLRGGPGQQIRLEVANTARWRQRGVAVLAAACVLLACVAAAIPFVQQSGESRRIERQIAALRPAVDRAEVLRRDLAAAAAGVDVLTARRAQAGNAIATIAALTEVLPDDTVLTDLALKQRMVTLIGQSASAAKLIPALAADPAFRDPAFIAASTRNDTLRSEGFSIRVEAAP